MFYRDERLALFIDGANLYAAAKALGFDIDYKLLRQEFTSRGKCCGRSTTPHFWRMMNIHQSDLWLIG